MTLWCWAALLPSTACFGRLCFGTLTKHSIEEGAGLFFYIVRRLLISVPILLASSFVMFWLVTISGDPLAEFRLSTDPNREQILAQVRARLELDRPFFERYFDWLTDVMTGDFGLNRDGQEVSVLLKQAAGTTLRLVLIATLLSILLGVFIGVISAVRQYSAIDYTSTFAAFLCFSLPVFWIAVLLKEFGAIKFNNYLEQPGLSVAGSAILTALTALIAAGLAGGRWTRRLAVGAGAAAVAAIALTLIDRSNWLTNPGLSMLATVVLAIGAGVAAAGAFAPLSNQRVVASGVAAALAGVVGSWLFRSWLDDMSWTRLGLLFLLSACTGVVIGAAVGGVIDRQAATRTGFAATFGVGVIVVFDRLLSAWEPGRTIATIGPRTPNLDAPFWETLIDYFGHQVLPSLALALIGFATYMRYTRASMLDTLDSDYVRTAKAKGLPTTQVVLRHAFRTALIPVATVIAINLGAVIDGAIITETVFGWQGMGKLFVDGLNEVDPFPVMGFLILTSVAVVVANAVADILYAYLDPRIRQ